MKTLYLDCGMGAAGDMLTAALIDLFDNPESIVNELNSLNLPGIRYELVKEKKCGISGLHMNVYANGEMEGHHHHDHDHEHHHEHHDHSHEHEHHHHYGLHDIEHIVKGHTNASEKVKNDVMKVYEIIARAESEVHGEEMDHIHFHEVGSMDAIADITAVCYLIDKLGVDKIIASPVHVGSGTVKCAHGILPVPAPATALILKDVPIYSRANITGELCTPTGAALLKHFVSSFENMPVMKVEGIGYGLGTKDFEVANCLRAMLGSGEDKVEEVIELNFNVDDMTGEEIALACEILLANGVNEVFTTPVNMKKSRPGTLFTVIVKPAKKQEIVELIFKHTETLGIRETGQSRYYLERHIENVETSYGKVALKVSSGYGVNKAKFEYEDLAAIAKKEGKSLHEIRTEVIKESHEKE